MLNDKLKREKKICFVLTHAATVRVFFIPQLQYLAEAGFDVTVVCSKDKTLQEDIGNKIRCKFIGIPRGISFCGSVKSTWNLYRYFKQQKFDLIQYSTPNAAFYASIASRLAGCQIRNYHLMGLRYLGMSGVGRLIFKIIEKLTCQNSTSIECVSNSNLQLGIQEGLFDEKKATVVWNGSTGGVDLSRFDYSRRVEWRNQVRRELGYHEDDFIFGFVGRITRDKGINEIFQAFSECGNKAKLLLIGAAEGMDTLNQELLQKVRKNPNVQFHDKVSDIERYYAAIDILLLPSYREGFGNVIIEAAAVGTPAIISDIPGPIDAVKNGKTAYVVPAKDVPSLAEAMKKCMACSSSLIPMECVEFAAQRFDSMKLCKKIYDRKRALIDGGQ